MICMFYTFSSGVRGFSCDAKTFHPHHRPKAFVYKINDVLFIQKNYRQTITVIANVEGLGQITLSMVETGEQCALEILQKCTQICLKKKKNVTKNKLHFPRTLSTLQLNTSDHSHVFYQLNNSENHAYATVCIINYNILMFVGLNFCMYNMCVSCKYVDIQVCRYVMCA